MNHIYIVLLILTTLVSSLGCRSGGSGPVDFEIKGEGFVPASFVVVPNSPTLGPMHVGCSQAEFFIDAKEASSTPDPDFRSRLENKLSSDFRKSYCQWFAGDTTARSPGCFWHNGSWVAPAAAVRVSALMGERKIIHENSTCLAHYGHLRFFRATFLFKREPLIIPDIAICSAIALLRGSANVTATPHNSLPMLPRSCFMEPSHSKAPIFSVGRVCLATPLQNAPQAPSPSLPQLRRDSWYFGHLGIENKRGPDGSRKSNLVLIDSGIPRPASRSGIQRHVASGAMRTPMISFPDPSTRAMHGGAMAVLARGVSMGTSIWSIRVTAGLGGAKTGRLALATESAVFDIPSPRVISISMGWPPELGSIRSVSSTIPLPAPPNSKWEKVETCSSEEDPIGESLRFALGLGRHDPRDSQVTVAVASAGNRRAFESSPPPDEILNGKPEAIYYPAEWHKARSSVSPWDEKERAAQVVTTAGAIDWFDQRVTSTIPPRNLALEAPGQHVTLHPEALRTAFGSASPITQFTWTGTSVSTLLVAAIAATVQGVLIRAGLSPRKDIIDLLTSSGDPIGGRSRRPNICRALCNVSTSANGPSQCLASCRTSSAPFRPGSPFPGTPLSPKTVQFVDTSISCDTGKKGMCLMSTEAGEASPQPNPTVCPSCLARLTGNGNGTADVILRIVISSEYPATNTFGDQHLTIYFNNGTSKTTSIANKAWTPGEQFELEVKGIPLPGSLKIMAAELVLRVAPEGTWDISPFAILP